MTCENNNKLWNIISSNSYPSQLSAQDDRRRSTYTSIELWCKLPGSTCSDNFLIFRSFFVFESSTIDWTAGGWEGGWVD